jgi:hypothetical protein
MIPGLERSTLRGNQVSLGRRVRAPEREESMKLARYALVLATCGVLLFGASSASAAAKHATKLTLDSSVAVGDGYYVDSGRLITSGFPCDERSIRLVGVRPDGKKNTIDWVLTSVPGNAWATMSRRTGYKTVRAVVPESKRCKGAAVLVYRR